MQTATQATPNTQPAGATQLNTHADNAVDSYLSSLNNAQYQAACFTKTNEPDPLLIIAGAGTGKTMTLAHRVAHLILNGTPPERILLLTFSRRAADEMTRRAQRIVQKALKDQNHNGINTIKFEWAGTFHSIANRILRRYAYTVGLEPSFSVLDRGDSADLLNLARQELKLSASARRFPKKDACLALYSHRVNTLKPLQECLQQSFPWCLDWQTELTQLFRRYVELKQLSQCLDYDDLLLYWYHLVSDPEIAAEIGDFFDHVLVDEYQDTNLLQAKILHALKPDGKGITAVGDDAQSIYSFRAADVDNILNFPDHFNPPATVIRLEQNYRSVQPILESANCLMNEASRQYQKKLYSIKASKQKPFYVTVEDSNAESDYIVTQILAHREAGQALKSQAVLFRNAHHSDNLELELLRRNIPYVKYGGLKFLEAAHIKDLLAIMKWADNPKNRVAAFRVIQLLPGIGPAHAQRCIDHLALVDYSMQSLSDFKMPASASESWPSLVGLMQSLTASTTQEYQWQSQITQVRQWYQPYLETLYDAPHQREADLEQLELVSGKYANRERFLSELTLDPPSSTGDLSRAPLIDEDYLILSTVHSAKGQEWDSVYLLNVTDGNFPSEFSTGDAAQTEEERRLMYVAMTRARNDLHLISPLRFHVTQQHRYGDQHVYGTRSRFMTETVLATMDKRFHGAPASEARGLKPRSNKTMDIAGEIRALF